ncbi:hypothetical protein [Natrinema soli]|uniref:hypothetical protein n=1 Tax=Natrinema soli TaxID=1930624 RepID=UPI00235F7ABD|nr:hypothetical protein [Natrinema soli]
MPPGLIIDKVDHFEISNPFITNCDVGLEVTENARYGRITDGNIRNNLVADIAYTEDSRVKIINTVAYRLFNLTEGSFNSIDRELQPIAYQLLGTQDLDIQRLLLLQLRQKILDNSDIIRLVRPHLTDILDTIEWVLSDLI